MNKMIVIGNLVRDPELRTMQDGSAVCNFTVAVNRRLRSGEDAADYIRVSVWGNLGDTCAKYLIKGSKVCVVGRASARGYTGNDGTVRAELNIVASEVEFLHLKRLDEPQTDAQQEQYTEVDDDELPFV